MEQLCDIDRFANLRRAMSTPEVLDEDGGVSRCIDDDVLSLCHVCKLTSVGRIELYERRVDEVAHCAQKRCIVGQRRNEARIARITNGDAGRGKSRRCYEQTCARHLSKSTIA